MKTNILLVLLYICGAAHLRSEEVPIFDRTLTSMIKELITVGDNDTPDSIMERIVGDCGPAPALALVAHLRYVHDNGELRYVREIMKKVTPSVSNTIIEQLRNETEPGQKGKLIQCLRDYDGPDVMRVLKTELDDERVSAEPHGFERPRVVGVVRVEAYNVLIEKLEKPITAEKRRALRKQLDNMTSVEREERFEVLKQRLTILGF